jgi:hypothetical protein
MVFFSLVQQILQRPILTQTSDEECDFVVKGSRLEVIAEIATVQRVLECAHPILCRVGKHRERGDT